MESELDGQLLGDTLLDQASDDLTGDSETATGTDPDGSVAGADDPAPVSDIEAVPANPDAPINIAEGLEVAAGLTSVSFATLMNALLIPGGGWVDSDKPAWAPIHLVYSIMPSLEIYRAEIEQALAAWTATGRVVFIAAQPDMHINIVFDLETFDNANVAAAAHLADCDWDADADVVPIGIAPATLVGGMAPGTFAFEAVLHEIGHALGLSHPGPYNADDTPRPTYTSDALFREDNKANTIMSYWSERFGGTESVSSAMTPMLADYAALNLLYGSNLDTITNTYGVGGTLMQITSYQQPVSGCLIGEFGTLDVSLLTGDCIFVIAPDVAYFTVRAAFPSNDFNNVQTAYNAVTTIIGSQGWDKFDASNGSLIVGHYHFDGKSGDDTMTGSVSETVLLGGSGNDKIVSRSIVSGVAMGEDGDDDMTVSGKFFFALGGTGNDTIIVSGKNGLVSGGDGDDIVSIQDGAENLRIDLGSGQDTLTFQDRTTGVAIDLTGDAIEGAPANTFTFGYSNENGLVGTDPLSYRYTTLSNLLSFNVAMGDYSIETIIGTEQADIFALNTSMTLSTLAGDDRVFYRVGGSAILDGGNGYDTFDLSKVAPGYFTLAITFNGAAFTADIDGYASGNCSLTSFEGLVGSQGRDIITGGSFRDVSLGLGNDTYTGATASIIEGSSFVGGNGEDWDQLGFVQNSTDALTIDLEDGTILLGEAHASFAGWETFSLGVDTNAAAGTLGLATLLGSSADDDLVVALGAQKLLVDGRDGNDTITLSGQVPGATWSQDADGTWFARDAGGNVLAELRNIEQVKFGGGAGSDNLGGVMSVPADGSVTVVEYDGGGGWDKLTLDLSSAIRVGQGYWTKGKYIVAYGENGSQLWIFVENIESVTVIGSATGETDVDLGQLYSSGSTNEPVTGVVKLTGGPEADALAGSVGEDVIEGGDGDDYILGGFGADILRGGNGDDAFDGITGTTADYIDGGNGWDHTFIDLTEGPGVTFSYRYKSLDPYYILSASIEGDNVGPSLKSVESFDCFFGTLNDTVFYSAASAGLNQSPLQYGFYDSANDDADLFKFDGGDVYSTSLVSGWEPGYLALASYDGAGNVISTVYFNIKGYNGFENFAFLGGDADDTVNLNGFVFEEAMTMRVDLDGRKGNDILGGAAGNDMLHGGEGNDQLWGGDGDDKLYGGYDDDTLHGGGGNDTLSGGQGQNTVFGGEGDDEINGDFGINEIDGGDGVDTFTTEFDFADATFSRVDGKLIVKFGNTKISTLTNVERIEFWDGVYEVADLLATTNADPERSGSPLELHGTEDQSFTFDPLFGMVDPNGDPLHFGTVTSLSGATWSLADDGRLVITPAENLNGDILVWFTVFDDHGGWFEARQVITFDAANDVPVLTGDTLVIPDQVEGEAFTLTQAQLLEGFTDIDFDDLAAGTLSGNHLAIVDNGDGTYTITPELGFTGMLQLDYVVDDGHGGQVSMGVEFTVNPAAPPQPPVLSGQPAQLSGIAEDSGPFTFTLSDLLEGWSDPKGLPLSVTDLAVSGGTLVDLGNGSYRIDLPQDFNGDISITYTVGNGTGLTASAGLTGHVDGVNDAPTSLTLIGGSIDEETTGSFFGLFAGNFSASDVDTTVFAPNGQYEQLTFSIVDDPSGLFYIGSGEGGGGLRVVKGTKFDYETKSSYDILVRVTDAAGAWFEQVITVHINDVDESVVLLTKGDDVFVAGDDIDRSIQAFGGNDFVGLGNGNDTADGGTGIDTVSYEAALQAVTVSLALSGVQTTGAGLDKLTGFENLVGSAFDDILSGNSLANAIDGRGGNDILRGGGSNDVVTGGDGDDQLYGDAGDDQLVAGSGNDLMKGGFGNDLMQGGAGDDKYYVDSAGDVIEEAALGGLDVVFSSVNWTLANEFERLVLSGAATHGTGNAAANILTGNALDNVLAGEGGDDRLVGGDGNDTLTGGEGIDTLVGQNGDDSLVGGLGADRLNGDAGNDTLTGGLGVDTLTGGAGVDRFVFDTLENSASADKIKDFVVGEDLLVIDRAAFDGLSGLAAGSLSASALALGKAATTADQHFIYDASTGALFYDADGVGGDAQIRIALLTGNPALSASDFLLV